MSLKAVHIFFVTIATAIAVFFGVWSVQQVLATGTAADWVLAILAVLMALALPPYGVWFLKKMKKVGYV